MAFTQDQIDALEDAIAKGVTSVSYGDRTIDYRSLDEMERILEKMKNDVNDEEPTRRTNPQFDNGL